MKQIFAILSLMILSIVCNAQDLIYFKDGTMKQVAIANVGKSKIKYFEVPNKTGNAFVVNKEYVTMIRYSFGRVVTFPEQPVNTHKRTDTLACNLKTWTVDAGFSNILGSTYGRTNSPGFSAALLHQYGYQITKTAHISIGGEFRMYNSTTNDTNKVSHNNNICYLGVPLSLHLLSLTSKTAWVGSLTASGGIRYFNSNKTSDINIGGNVTLSLGGAYRFGKTYAEIGPYVNYSTFVSDINAISYGLRLTIIK